MFFPGQGTGTFSGRSSDSRLLLLPRLPINVSESTTSDSGSAGFVPGYSGGPVPELHRVPFSSVRFRTDT